MTDNFVTIKEFVEEIGNKYADNIAYRFFREEVIEDRTYTNLRNDAFSLASFFVSKKYVNKHIAILGGTSYEWVVSFLAVIMSGNIVVPIDKMLLEKEMMFLFEQGDIDIILYDEEFEQTAKNAKKDIKKVKNIYCMLSEDFAEALKTKEVELPETNPDELAEILFTSGTTGVSKGVMLSQTNIVSNIIEIRRKDYASNVSGNPVVLSVLPIHHTFELTVDNLGILAYGVTICINDKLENIAANMNLFKPSVILIVPAIAEALYKKVKDAMNTPSTARKMKGGQKLVDAAKVLKMDVRRSVYKQLLDKFGGNLTNVVVGGAALRPEICELFDKFGINVYQGYGLTECAPLVASNDPGNNKVGSVGKCVSYMEAKTINGEIVVKGPGVMLGYYKNEEATKEAIKDGWFYTGDLGYIDEDGYIFITGRSKNIIILDNGKNIYPEELEDKIITIDGVKDVFVYSDKGRLCTLILPENPGDKDKKKAIEGAIKKLNETLPAYKRITFISFTHREFPKTTTLKIKRKDLMEMIKTQLVKNEVKYVPASNPTEEKLVNAFEQILSKRVGIYDDFFELGGDSLSALELAAIVGINAQEQ